MEDDNRDEMEGFEFDDEGGFGYDDEMFPVPPSPATDSIETIMESMLEVARVEAVYGAPIQHGDTVIIPAAEVMTAMGFGLGSGGSEDEKPSENGGGGNSGAGGGGGGTSFSRPVAVIVSGPDGVRIEPVFDVTKIVLAGISAGVFMLGMMSQVRSTRRKFKQLQRQLSR